MTTLISFDVDGTLTHSVGQRANFLHKQAFTAAFKKVFDLDTHIDVVKHHGSTDALILLKVLTHHGVSQEEAAAKLPDLMAAMVEHYLSNAAQAGEGLELLPGVQALLEALAARSDVAVGLVTGNLEPIGWAKMDALGIRHLFTHPNFGGFSTDYCNPENVEQSWRDRAEFVRIAASKCEAQLQPGGPGIKAWYHVGDAPMDVQAAVGGGAKAVGVCTGIYTRQELVEAAPEAVVLDDLNDLPAVLRTFDLA
ncbi:haloacid dehalogenase [Micractinium conductrix]|uniref:Haloacid dehalogenase n=1 Tax=Micractinium conductrix TaxID=554055 RepID=A0A2P6VE43_9CHLO|nr:haloacid dehalogenase [Micractinium conductrix]|eukprot:PSC72331.1 haloacid dehalogenase [Micractinium conductrix]